MTPKTIFTALLALSLIVATGGIGAAVMGGSDVTPDAIGNQINPMADDASGADDFEGTEDEFEANASAVNASNDTITLEDGRVVDVSNATIEADTDLDSLAAVAAAVDNEQRVEVEGYAELADGDADLTAQSVKYEVEHEMDDEADEADEFEGTEDEFEANASAVSESASTITLEDGRVVDVSDATIEADTDLASLADVASAIDNGQAVEVEGYAELADGDADLTAQSVKYEVEHEMEEEHEETEEEHAEDEAHEETEDEEDEETEEGDDEETEDVETEDD
jgi:hypothetical protein